ncbi:hypothetical protein [Xylophilus sp.]|uniref:hypothetical protein n=1 Tax=Xylophilus sp. TaxID=2653893 RepID=UPI0013BD875C|nr:hypothetical protein [Xylophilus sp.]KAF1045001.1 MAG: hypothetical protein GAK38_03227 [Xylophilus sp.]
MSSISALSGSTAVWQTAGAQQPSRSVRQPPFVQNEAHEVDGADTDSTSAEVQHLPSPPPPSTLDFAAGRSDEDDDLFARLDTDGVGSDGLSTLLDQFAEDTGTAAADVLAALDQDGGGALSASELTADATTDDTTAATDPLLQIFDAIDGNGDGSLSSDEAQDFADALSQAVAGNDGGAAAAVDTRTRQAAEARRHYDQVAGSGASWEQRALGGSVNQGV